MFRPAPGGSGEGYTMFPTGYADFPMPQRLRTDHDGRRVTISCLVSDLRFEWRLRPTEGGTATEIQVHVDIPEQDALRLATSAT